MCLLCVDGVDPLGDVARRLHVLGLLALIEHPDALSHSAALRLSREIMAIIGPSNDRFRCDPVAADGATGEDS
jgi:hypothetical protein